MLRCFCANLGFATTFSAKQKHNTSIQWTVAATSLFSAANLTCEVGHIDLIFGVRLGFTSRSVRARLQLSVCSGYDLCHPG